MLSTLPNPVPFSAELEEIEPNEPKIVSELNATFDEILKTTSADYGHAVRAVHAKAHAILEGTLTVKEGLTPELAQGLFATPGQHRVLMRISTNAGDLLEDAISLPRGLALKVLDVDGTRLPGADGRTQDFVMVNGPTFLAKTAEKFAGNLKLLAKTTDRMEEGKKVLSAVMRGVNTALTAVGVKSSTVQNLGGAPNVDPLGETYFSVTPFRYGDYVAKFSVAPVAPELIQLKGRTIDAGDNPDAIRDTVRAEMRVIEGVWDFRVQLCRDLDDQPIEDPTVEWDHEKYPFQSVGTIRVAPQDSWDPAKVQAVDEETRFSIWTGLAAHQPLGNVNRARRDTYRHSAEFRQAFNRCPIHEPG